MVGECHDGVVDRRHPRVELLVEPAREVPDVGPADRDQRSVHGETLVATVLDHLLEAGSDRQHGLAGSCPSIKSDDLDGRVE